MKSQKTLNSQSNPEKEEQSWQHQASWFQIYYKALVIKKVWYWHYKQTCRTMEQKGISEINTCIYGQLSFNKGSENKQWRKDSLINKWCWENLISICKWMKLDSYITPYSKIYSKWLKDLNMRHENRNS